jgi:hypothetical protein
MTTQEKTFKKITRPEFFSAFVKILETIFPGNKKIDFEIFDDFDLGEKAWTKFVSEKSKIEDMKKKEKEAEEIWANTIAVNSSKAAVASANMRASANARPGTNSMNTRTTSPVEDTRVNRTTSPVNTRANVSSMNTSSVNTRPGTSSMNTRAGARTTSPVKASSANVRTTSPTNIRIENDNLLQQVRTLNSLQELEEKGRVTRKPPVNMRGSALNENDERFEMDSRQSTTNEMVRQNAGSTFGPDFYASYPTVIPLPLVDSPMETRFGNSVTDKLSRILSKTSLYDVSELAVKISSEYKKRSKVEPNRFGKIRDLVEINRPEKHTDYFKNAKLVFGIDSLKLASMDFAKNGVLQVASQFNFLESTTDNYTPISGYISDPTQGPRASLSVPISLAARDLEFRNKDLNSSLFETIPGAKYKGGYYEPSFDTKQAAIEYGMISKRISELLILAQDGYDCIGGNLVTQVFCAAPSFQGRNRPEEGSIQSMICDILIEAQYEAIAKLAVSKSIKTKSVVPLHLTLVGQGAFNNNKSAILKGVLRAMQVLEGHQNKVNAYIHVFEESGLRNLPKEFALFDKYQN